MPTNGFHHLLAGDFPFEKIGRSLIIHADCLEWLSRIPENSIHAVVTDPPYGIKEYDADQLDKRAAGSGGVWRIPPSFDGHTRAPLPRFTAPSTRANVAGWGSSLRIGDGLFKEPFGPAAMF